MRTLILLLLCGLSCFAQTRVTKSGAFVGASRTMLGGAGWTDTRYVTNIAGYPVAAYWEGAVVVTDASGFVTNWTDLYTNQWNLTNSAAGKSPSTNSVNARKTLSFDGSNDFIKADNVNVPSQFEVAMVVKWKDTTNGTARYYWAGTNNAIVYAQMNTAGNHRCNFGTGAGIGSAIVTNKWMVINWASGANKAYTNTVQDITGITGSSALTGFTVAGILAGGNSAPIEVGEIVIYATNLTATLRENLYEYFTNKYAMSPP